MMAPEIGCSPKIEDGRAPLEALQDARLSGARDQLGVEHVASVVQLPVATVRGVLSWYADLHSDPSAIRICRGTSCVLAGADHVASVIAAHQNCRDVYCVGYCDRSPALLLPDGRVLTHGRADTLSASAELVQELLPDRPAQAQATDLRNSAREPIVTGRLMRGDCAELDAARAVGAYASLDEAFRASPETLLNTLEQSGIRGRGGAGFPTGQKWRACARAAGQRKYVIANGDEGDPGSFIDRELMERDPHSIIEGMLLAAYAVGAAEGIIFIRSEYPRAIHVMQIAIAEATAAGLIGAPNGNRTFAFDLRVVTGLGSYVCGEETAMLNAIEGKRGEARPRPPYPAEHGLHGRPTVVDNVETLVNVPWIVRNGPIAYRAIGTPGCPGTMALCLNHGFARPGIVEVEFGTPLRRVIDELACGPAQGSTLQAVLLGGPMGSVVLPPDWDVPVCLDAMAQRGLRLGHGGIVALPCGTDFAGLLRHMLQFMADESCGKCAPCRIGTRRAFELAGRAPLSTAELPTLARIFDLMEQASLCGFGREAPGPVRQLIDCFGSQILKGGDR